MLMDRQRVSAGVACAAALVCVYAIRQVDPDLYGYLAYGRLFLQVGKITTHDPFAYTSDGSEWVTFEWLAHVLLWLSYQFAGPVGLIALKCIIGGFAVWLLYLAIRAGTEDSSAWLPVFLLSTATVSRFFLFRPQIFTFAFFALFVAVLFGYLLKRRAPLWMLPAAMLLWANAHGGFLAGLGAVVLAILLRIGENVSKGRDQVRLLHGTRPLWITLAACTALTFVNPRGARLWQYVITEMLHGTNRQYMGEWRPPHTSGDLVTFVSLIGITLALVLLGWLAFTRVRSEAGPPARLLALSCAPTIVMSYISIRHTPIAFIWAAPVISLLSARFKTDTLGRPLLRVSQLTIITLGLTWTLFAAVYVVKNPKPVIAAGGRTLGAHHPCRVVAFLRENGVTGNVYTPLWWGAYVTWELYPAVRVSMDGRNISLFPRAMVIENLQFYLGKTSDGDLAAPLRYDTDFLLVPTSSSGLHVLRTDTRWQMLYSDSDAALFVRADRRGIVKPLRHTRQMNAAAMPCSPIFQ
jgi:hypothetical protein